MDGILSYLLIKSEEHQVCARKLEFKVTEESNIKFLA